MGGGAVRHQDILEGPQRPGERALGASAHPVRSARHAGVRRDPGDHGPGGAHEGARRRFHAEDVTVGRTYSLLSTPPGRSRAVLTQEEATTLGTKLLSMVKNRSVGVKIEHTARAVTKVANGRVVATDDGDEL